MIIGPKACVMQHVNCCCACQVSERAIVQVFERCHELEVVDIVPARWHAAQDLLLWQTVSFSYIYAHTHYDIIVYIPHVKYYHKYIISVYLCVYS